MRIYIQPIEWRGTSWDAICWLIQLCRIFHANRLILYFFVFFFEKWIKKNWNLTKKSIFLVFLFDLTLAVPFSFSSGCSRLSPHVSHHNELKLPVSLVTLARRPEGELDKWRHWDFSKTFTAMIEVICFLFFQKMLKLHPI